MPRTKQLDTAVLEAALEGLEMRLAEVSRNIEEVRRRIGGGKVPAAKRTTRRPLSAAARKRISEAQKRRWAQTRARGTGKRRSRAAKRSQAQASASAAE